MDLQELLKTVQKITFEERESILKEATEELRKLIEKVPVKVLLGDNHAYGDYSGTPHPRKSPFAAFHYPSDITIYARPYAALAKDGEILRKKIRIVLIHEYGHFLGLSEGELRQRGVY